MLWAFCFSGLASAQTEESVRLKQDLRGLLNSIGSTKQASGIGQEGLGKECKPSIEQTLIGKVPGLWVKERSGMPGEGASFYWRGVNSFRANQTPLVVVDGIPYETYSLGYSMVDGFYNNPLANINPNEVQSITFVRDAVAVWGSRAVNGVLMIETTKADKVQTEINFRASGGIVTAPEKISLLNGAQFRGLASDLASSGFSSHKDIEKTYPFLLDDPNAPLYHQFNNETDWQDEVFSDAKLQEYNISVSGGDEIAKYAFSLGYTNREGLYKNTDFTRYNINMKGDINITRSFKFEPNMSIVLKDNALMHQGLRSATNPLLAAYKKSPLLSAHAKDDEGRDLPYYSSLYFGVSTPTVLIENSSADIRSYRALASSKFTYDFGKAFKVNLLFGLDFNKSRERIFIPQDGVINRYEYSETGKRINYNGMRQGVERSLSYFGDLYATKLHRWGKHQLDARAGLRYRTVEIELDNAYDFGSPSDDFKSEGQGCARSLRRVLGGVSDNVELTAYGVANYSFDNRYLATLGLAYDGSSRVGEEASSYALFPSAGFEWRLTSESFLKDSQLFSLLSLRTNFSLVGNDRFNALLGRSAFRPVQGILSGVIHNGLVNKELEREQTTNLDFGVDAGLWNRRINISAVYYFRKTTNVIVGYELREPLSGMYYDNGGEIENKGWELAADVRLLDKELKFDLGFNISKNENQFTKLSASSNPLALQHSGKLVEEIPGDGQVVLQVGAAMNQYYGYRALGVFSTTEQAESAGLKDEDGNPFSAGDMIFDDVDNNKIINANDMQAIGNTMPEYVGGAFAKFNYKRFELSAYCDFATGCDVYNYSRVISESMYGMYNQSKAVLRRWRAEGDQTSMPSATMSDPMGNSRFSTRWIEDGSYIRLKTVSLTYSVPKLKFYQNMKLYFTVDNVMTRKDYLGYQPSEAAFGGAGAGLSKMPSGRSFIIGVQLGL